jgi:hypothetical protein
MIEGPLRGCRFVTEPTPRGDQGRGREPEQSVPPPRREPAPHGEPVV